MTDDKAALGGELLPCKCGATAKRFKLEGMGMDQYRVGCSGVMCKASTAWCGDRETADAAWNRVDAVDVADLVRRARDSLPTTKGYLMHELCDVIEAQQAMLSAAPAAGAERSGEDGVAWALLLCRASYEPPLHGFHLELHPYRPSGFGAVEVGGRVVK